MHALLSDMNYHWGKFVARRPLSVLAAAAVVYMLCLPGLLLLEGEAKARRGGFAANFRIPLACTKL